MTDFNPHTHHRSDDPDTSVAAAHAAGDLARSHKALCLEVIRSAGSYGAGQSDIAEVTGLHRHQANKRLADLHTEGKIALRLTFNGVEIRRKGSANRQERIWVLADE